MTVEWNDGLVGQIRQAAMTGVVRGTEDVRTEGASLMINSPRTGRVYRRGGVTHKASAPGEPPAPDTGYLLNSIRTEYDTAELLGRVIFGANYAQHLEYGTVKMARRPYARVALTNKNDAVQADIVDEIASVLK